MKRQLLTGLTLVAVVGLLLVSSGCRKDNPTAKTSEKSPFVNDHCPIMPQNAIDPDNVPPNLTRDFHGKKVAFCCSACPSKWDKLSEAEKAAKLAKVTPQTEALHINGHQ